MWLEYFIPLYPGSRENFSRKSWGSPEINLTVALYSLRHCGSIIRKGATEKVQSFVIIALCQKGYKGPARRGLQGKVLRASSCGVRSDDSWHSYIYIYIIYIMYVYIYNIYKTACRAVSQPSSHEPVCPQTIDGSHVILIGWILSASFH